MRLLKQWLLLIDQVAKGERGLCIKKMNTYIYMCTRQVDGDGLFQIEKALKDKQRSMRWEFCCNDDKGQGIIAAAATGWKR